MKKITAIVLALIMVFSFSACTSYENTELNTELEDILTSITSEVQTLTDEISSVSDTIIENMGDTIEGYTKYKDKVFVLYDEIEFESECLFENIQGYSIKYYENVATLCSADYERWDFAMEEFYRVWDDSMESYHDVCFESVNALHSKCEDLLKAEFYNDMIDSDTYFKEKAEIDKEYEEIQEIIYDLNLSAWGKVNSEYNIVCNGFYDGIFNVDAILEKENDEASFDEE